MYATDYNIGGEEKRREATRQRQPGDEKMNANETTVCGHQIQRDASGVGHAWRNIDAADIPANIREEIEGEIIDGGKGACACYRAINGLHYRW